jgi:hypothetical protein
MQEYFKRKNVLGCFIDTSGLPMVIIGVVDSGW